MSLGPPGSAGAPLRVAVVGSGPSGMYAVAALLASDLEVRVDVFDRLPAPFGLVRYGVAPDHQKIKMVSRVFEKTMRDDRVRFFGNVEIGPDLTRAELARHYHQVVYAVGAQGDRRLDIPGEDLEGSISSTELVNWYNGHPDLAEATYSLQHESVAVVGIGNVAMDVARLLVASDAALAASDISDAALQEFRRRTVREVYVLARRGPAQAKCSPPELKELGELEGVDVVVEPGELALDPASQAAADDDRSVGKNLGLLAEFATVAASAPRRIRLRFLVSPVEVIGEAGRAVGLRVETNRLEATPSGYLAARGTGEHEVLPVTMVVRAIGYRSDPLLDLPYDARRGIVPNRLGRIEAADGESLVGEYVVGWVKRGPTGLIGSNKMDAQETVAAMLEDLAAGRTLGPAEPRPSAASALLASRGVRAVRYDEWERLDALERERGEAQGRPRVKFLSASEMLAQLD